MLSTDDEQLVHGDSSIPGLSLLLDPESLLSKRELLAWQDALDVRVEYLRYKPSTSCLALLRAQFVDREENAYVVAFGDSVRDKQQKSYNKFGSGVTPLSDDLGTLVFRFPVDRRLPALSQLANNDADNFLSRLLSGNDDSTRCALHKLRYKPERRYVGRVDQRGKPIATVKLYGKESFVRARRAAKTLAGGNSPGESRCIGHSGRHMALAFAWKEGAVLSNQIERQSLTQAGKATAALHRWPCAKLPLVDARAFHSRLCLIQRYLCSLVPEYAKEVNEITRAIDQQIQSVPFRQSVSHGDLHLDQFIVGVDEVSLIDFDRACLAPPEWDLANLQ
ncbi:MAG: phosphotransferase family protein, partial [Aeoliella sp.]